MNDIVLDADVARLFDFAADLRLKPLFLWLTKAGSLAVSRHLLGEYGRHGNQILAALIKDLTDQRRLNSIPNQAIKEFSEDRHYDYLCNSNDIPNARTVFLSHRKLLISFDNNLRRDVNGFRRVDGIKPRAYDYPPDSILTPN
jgi:hypothetical protein